jgi:hypothetical protein
LGDRYSGNPSGNPEGKPGRITSGIIEVPLLPNAPQMTLRDALMNGFFDKLEERMESKRFGS